MPILATSGQIVLRIQTLPHDSMILSLFIEKFDEVLISELIVLLMILFFSTFFYTTQPSTRFNPSVMNSRKTSDNRKNKVLDRPSQMKDKQIVLKYCNLIGH